ncbi:hypothetical protein ACLSZY_00180 [Avibacterium volantium]
MDLKKIFKEYLPIVIMAVGTTYTVTLAMISDQNASLKEINGNLKEKNTELEKSLEKLKVDFKSISDKKEFLEKSTDKVKSDLSDKDKINKELEEKIKSFKSQLSSEKNKTLNLLEIKSKYEIVLREKNELLKSNDTLKEEYTKLNNNYKLLLDNFDKLTNISREIEKLEYKEQEYRECNYFMHPKPKEIIEQCKENLKYTQSELSKLRQKLPY